MNARFGEIRALLHEVADERSWDELCAVLDELDEGELRDVYLPYLQAHLQRWNDVRRVAPWRWLEGVMRRDPASVAKVSVARVVDLSWRRLRRDQVERLLAHAPWSGITHLYLESCRLSPATLEQLVHHEALTNLRVLSLSRNPLSRDGAAVLSSASALVKLVALDLEGCFLDDRGVTDLLEATCFQELEMLDLSANVLGVAAMEALSACSQHQSLSALNLTSCVATAGAQFPQGGPLLDVLTSGERAWPHLQQLELGYWGLTARSVPSLNRPMCTRLRVIDLNGCALLESGATQLAMCEALGDVEILDLGRNRIGDDGAQALIAPDTQLAALHRILLPWNGISAAMSQRLVQAGYEIVL